MVQPPSPQTSRRRNYICLEICHSTYQTIIQNASIDIKGLLHARNSHHLSISYSVLVYLVNLRPGLLPLLLALPRPLDLALSISELEKVSNLCLLERLH